MHTPFPSIITATTITTTTSTATTVTEITMGIHEVQSLLRMWCVFVFLCERECMYVRMCVFVLVGTFCNRSRDGRLPIMECAMLMYICWPQMKSTYSNTQCKHAKTLSYFMFTSCDSSIIFHILLLLLLLVFFWFASLFFYYSGSRNFAICR